MLDNWQRIEQIIKWTGFASVSAFAREIGLNRSENLYQIKRGNNGISKDLAEAITSKFPDISKAWLLTGEGGMLKGDAPCKSYDIPFYKADAVKIVSMLGKTEPDHYISFPTFDGAVFGALTLSGAMEPDIPKGAILFFEQVATALAVPGEIYLVVSREFCGIRSLRREADGTHVRLVAKNSEHFDEVSVPLKSINKLYLVRGIVVER